MVYDRFMTTSHPRSDLPIILLAAGQSSRMRGRDKLLEKIDGVTLLGLQVRRARAATKGPVLVALPPAPHPRYAIIKDCDVTHVAVPDAASGMTASLRRASSSAVQSPEHVLATRSSRHSRNRGWVCSPHISRSGRSIPRPRAKEARYLTARTPMPWRR